MRSKYSGGGFLFEPGREPNAMPKPSDCLEERFYEFHRERANNEIGRMIPRPFAVQRLLRGEDVYTPLASDAKSLAKDVQKGKAEWEGAHQPGYFPHFHPADDHVQYGHVFYGERNYRLRENRLD
jgi:hypothetical protein